MRQARGQHVCRATAPSSTASPAAYPRSRFRAPSSSPRIASAAAKSRRARASRRAASRSSTHAASASSTSGSSGTMSSTPFTSANACRARVQPGRDRVPPRSSSAFAVRMNSNSARHRLAARSGHRTTPRSPSRSSSSAAPASSGVPPVARASRSAKSPTRRTAFDRRLERLLGEVQLLAIVHREHEMAHRRGRDALLAQVLHVGDVADALRHLRAVGEQELAVAPEARERLPVRALGLRDLILVMRKDRDRRRRAWMSSVSPR